MAHGCPVQNKDTDMTAPRLAGCSWSCQEKFQGCFNFNSFIKLSQPIPKAIKSFPTSKRY